MGTKGEQSHQRGEAHGTPMALTLGLAAFDDAEVASFDAAVGLFKQPRYFL